MNISDEHNSSAPAILTVQIVRCLGGLRIPREIYEPIGGAVPSISANTRAHYDAIMSKYSDWKIPMHKGMRVIQVIPFEG